MVASDCRYTEKHEWAKKEGDTLIIGISDFAQSELGDIVFVELPAEGDSFQTGDVLATIESVKAVSELYAPISGKITAVNSDLEETPELMNTSPFGDGWVFKVKPDDAGEYDTLLSPEDYEKFLAEEGK